MRKRLTAVIAVALICAGVSLSAGPGSASAVPWKSIVAAAEEIAPVLAKKFGLAESKVQSLFVSQVRSITPVTDDVALKQVQTAWLEYVPRAAPQGKVVTNRRWASRILRESYDMLCSTAANLLITEDKTAWQFVMNQANDAIEERLPMGRSLALYDRLNEITAKFMCGEYCAGTAMLAVTLAEEAYC